MALPTGISLIVFLLAREVQAQVADKVKGAYAKAHSDAVGQLNQRYVQDANVLIKFYMQGNDLERANLASAWIKRLSDADESNDIDQITPNPTSPDRLVALQSRYLKDRAETIAKVDRQYVTQAETAQRQVMQQGDLAAANSLAEFLKKIRAELGQAPPAVSSDISRPVVGSSISGGEALFAADKQKKWKVTKGEWKWDQTKLTGKGESYIEYAVNLQPPFVAVFKFTPKEGTREGVIFDDVGMQNAAYSDKIGLRGVKEDQYFAFQHGTTYRCAIVVARKKSRVVCGWKTDLHRTWPREKDGQNYAHRGRRLVARIDGVRGLYNSSAALKSLRPSNCKKGQPPRKSVKQGSSFGQAVLSATSNASGRRDSPRPQGLQFYLAGCTFP